MKLDKRIENERLIYTPFTTNKPKLHEKGYFTDDIHTFTDLENCDCRYGELVEHDGIDYAYPYCCESDDGCGDGGTTCDWFAFYIPESSLKQKEKQKQYRAFTIDEFLDRFDIGEVIVFRSKAMPEYACHVLFVGYVEDSKNNGMNIILGQYRFSLKELFSSYEYCDGDSDNWFSFGVEE